LRTFYSGTEWARHGGISLALLVWPLSVHLLRPAGDANLTAGNTLDAVLARFADGTISPETGLFAVDTFRARDGAARDDLFGALRGVVDSLHASEGIDLRGMFVAEPSKNESAEEVIQDDREAVVVTAYETYASALTQREAAMPAIVNEVRQLIEAPPETVLLQPAIRSAMRYR
jgi:hypothetical protein